MIAQLVKIITWLIAHWHEILVDVALVIAAASAIIKALEVLVALLALVAPKLGPLEKPLLQAAAWLDSLGKSLPLNAAALSPKKVLLMFCLLTATLPRTAMAVSPDWSTGPTLPVIQVRLAPIPGAPPVTQLAAGAGYQISVGFLPKTILGKQVDLIGASLAAFANLSSAGGAASLALMACGASDLICLGLGSDAIAVDQGKVSGLLSGVVTKQNLFALVSIGLSFDLGPHAAPTKSP